MIRTALLLGLCSYWLFSCQSTPTEASNKSPQTTQEDGYLSDEAKTEETSIIFGPTASDAPDFLAEYFADMQEEIPINFSLEDIEFDVFSKRKTFNLKTDSELKGFLLNNMNDKEQSAISNGLEFEAFPIAQASWNQMNIYIYGHRINFPQSSEGMPLYIKVNLVLWNGSELAWAGKIAELEDHRDVATSSPQNIRYQLPEIIADKNSLHIKRQAFTSDSKESAELSKLVLSYNTSSQTWEISEK